MDKAAPRPPTLCQCVSTLVQASKPSRKHLLFLCGAMAPAMPVIVPPPVIWAAVTVSVPAWPPVGSSRVPPVPVSTGPMPPVPGSLPVPVSVSVHSPVSVPVHAPVSLPRASTSVPLTRAVMPALSWCPAAGVGLSPSGVDAAARWPAASVVLDPVLSSGSVPGLISGPEAIPGPAGGLWPCLSRVLVVPAAVGATFWASPGLIPNAAVRPAPVVWRPVTAGPAAVPGGGTGEGVRGLGFGSWAQPLCRGLFQAAEGWGAAGGLAGLGGSHLCCCLLHRGRQGQSCRAEDAWGGCLRRTCGCCWRKLCRGDLQSCCAFAKAARAGSSQHGARAGGAWPLWCTQ